MPPYQHAKKKTVDFFYDQNTPTWREFSKNSGILRAIIFGNFQFIWNQFLIKRNRWNVIGKYVDTTAQHRHYKTVLFLCTFSQSLFRLFSTFLWLKFPSYISFREGETKCIFSLVEFFFYIIYTVRGKTIHAARFIYGF